MTIVSRSRVRGIAACAAVAVIGTGVAACGSKKSQQTDAVSTALQTPGVRMVVIPKQRNDLRIVVPPCSAAQVDQQTTASPPGSNEIVVPRTALTETVAVQP